MKSEWQTKKIGEVVDIRRGSSPRPIHKFLATEGMPWVKIADATSDTSRYIWKTNEFIIEDGVTKSVKVAPETLIVSNSATPGLPKIMKITACVHDGWLVFSNYRGITRDFLYYKFIDIRRTLVNQANGSVFQNLKTDIVKDFDIDIPCIETQKKIVEILSQIDEKIELNNAINNNLEQQAMALFKSWFIDFEPFDRQVPKTWINGVLGDFVEIKRGSSPRPIQNFLSDSGFHWLKISDATGISSPFINEIKEYIIEAGLKKTVYLKSGSLVLSNSATPGLPKILDIDTCIHDGWLYFPSSKFSNEYLYLYFKHIRDNLIALGNGSVFTNLKTDILKNYPTYLPTEDVLKKFDGLVQPIFSMILSKTREIKRLAEIRDTLLPKLMSGELDVSDTEL
jgi:type I restriction enzyme S subunit